MVLVGLVTSTKFTCNVRLDRMTKFNVALLLTTPPDQSVETTQLVKANPFVAVAVML